MLFMNRMWEETWSPCGRGELDFLVSLPAPVAQDSARHSNNSSRINQGLGNKTLNNSSRINQGLGNKTLNNSSRINQDLIPKTLNNSSRINQGLGNKTLNNSSRIK
jgi:hypothetical protein